MTYKEIDMEKVQDILNKLTIDEKIALTTGIDNWTTLDICEKGIQSVVMSDGPHGLRKEQIDDHNKNVFQSLPATAFPTASTVACSFDRDLIYLMGESLAEESSEQGVDIILGPGVNIKRSPLCGRNFEYFSEDPLLSGEMGAAFIQGVQSKGVGTSLKHFFANSQELRRMTSSSDVDERTLREIYLKNFEIAVKKGQPWTVMAAYNKINGVFATENEAYNEKVLYEEWGYEGTIISDWGATHDRVKALLGGTAITMPSDSENNNSLALAIKDNPELEKVLDKNCCRVIELAMKVQEQKKKHSQTLDSLKVAQKIIEDSLILLKNDDSILPLSPTQSIAFMGNFAKNPRYQGGGSSHVNSRKTISALDAVKEIADVKYCQGYLDEDTLSEALITEATQLAKEVDVAVLFVGLPEFLEFEGFDRKHMRIPDNHVALIQEVSKVNPNTVVVLHNGSSVEMSWAENVKGIIELYLGGDAVGHGIVNALFGKVNPSGRLAESFPYQLQDHSSYLFFGGEGDHVEYREGVFVGYRYFESKNMPVRYPFGYGLSYTDFSYSNLSVKKDNATERVYVSINVKNSGMRAGKEVVQLYVKPHKGSIIRPVIELKGFDKVDLKPQEQCTVTFELEYSAFAYWNTEKNNWAIDPGQYDVVIGKNSHEPILFETITLDGSQDDRIVLSEMSTIGELIKTKKGMEYWEEMSQRYFKAVAELGYIEDDATPEDYTNVQQSGDMHDLLMSLPLSTFSYMISDYSEEDLRKDIERLNKIEDINEEPKSWRVY